MSQNNMSIMTSLSMKSRGRGKRTQKRSRVRGRRLSGKNTIRGRSRSKTRGGGYTFDLNNPVACGEPAVVWQNDYFLRHDRRCGRDRGWQAQEDEEGR